MEEIAPEYIDLDTCSGVVRMIINVLVIIKAVVLIAVSTRGIVWFCRRSFKSIVIIGLLTLSIALVIGEVIYRFTEENLRYRFI